MQMQKRNCADVHIWLLELITRYETAKWKSTAEGAGAR